MTFRTQDIVSFPVIELAYLSHKFAWDMASSY